MIKFQINTSIYQFTCAEDKLAYEILTEDECILLRVYHK
jgi:hypothetical protein